MANPATEIIIGDAAFCAAIGFLGGTFTAGLGWNIVPAVFAMLASAVVFKLRIIYSAIFLVSLAAGFLYFFFVIGLRASAVQMPFGKSVSFAAIISDEPKESTNYLLLTVAAEQPFAGTLTIFAPLGGVFHYGDELKVEGQIEAPRDAADGPTAFPQYIKVVAQHKGFWLREGLIDFKAAILEKFDEVLPRDEAALLGGELLGGMNGMSADLKNQMSASGMSYVVSMYGYKISMIIGFFEAALGELVARRWRFLLLGVVIFLFVMMSGGNVSAVRAAVMAILGLIAKFIGRSRDPRNALALTALGMTLFDPTLPVQAGFELSVWSIVGMFYLVGPLDRLFGWEDGGKGFLDWREALVVAIASLLPIIPIIAASFGDFGLSAFPSNAFISIAVMPALLCGVALALLDGISIHLSFLFVKLVNVLMFYQFTVIKVFAAVAIPLPLSFDSVFAFALYYGALAWFIYEYR